MAGRYRASFLITCNSLREPDLVKTIESVRAQELLEWECILYTTHPPHEWEILELTLGNPRFKIGTSDESYPWSDMRSEVAIRVLSGTVLTPQALSSILRCDLRESVLVYGDSTEVVRPEWSPLWYQNSPYFGDVVAFVRESSPTASISRLAVPLSSGSSLHFAPISRASALAIADCASSVSVKTFHKLPQPPDNEVALAPLQFVAECNRLAVSSESDVLLFLPPEIELESSNWTDEVARLLAIERVGAVTGVLVDEDGEIVPAAQEPAPPQTRLGRHFEPPYSPASPYGRFDHEIDCLTGSFFAIRRECFLAVGGMNEDLPFELAQVDLGFKLKMLGWSVAFNPRLVGRLRNGKGPKRVEDTTGVDLLHRRWGRFLRPQPTL